MSYPTCTDEVEVLVDQCLQKLINRLCQNNFIDGNRFLIDTGAECGSDLNYQYPGDKLSGRIAAPVIHGTIIEESQN